MWEHVALHQTWFGGAGTERTAKQSIAVHLLLDFVLYFFFETLRLMLARASVIEVPHAALDLMERKGAKSAQLKGSTLYLTAVDGDSSARSGGEGFGVYHENNHGIQKQR